MSLKEAIKILKNNGMNIEKKTKINTQTINGNGRFRKCSICGKTIIGPDDCDFTEDENCTCTTCQRNRMKRRSKGNKFVK